MNYKIEKPNNPTERRKLAKAIFDALDGDHALCTDLSALAKSEPDANYVSLNLPHQDNLTETPTLFF